MRPLDEVEPRVSVQSLPSSGTATHVIAEPGSYHLVGNISGEPGKDGIRISSGNVTLDLGGFSLTGQVGSGHGIFVEPTLQHISIHGGTVTLWDGSGISADNVRGVRIHGLTARRNGGHGIQVNDNGLVADCIASENGSHGFSLGGNTVLTRGIAEGNTDDGVRAGSGCRIANCTVRINMGDGIVADEASLITGCISRDNRGDGIEVTDLCQVSGNLCINNDFENDGEGSGVHAVGDDNRIDGNSCVGNAVGTLVEGEGNLVVRNSARANSGGDFSVPAGTNTVGATLTGPGTVTGDPWANVIH